MKRRPIRIANITIKPKQLLLVVGALFIFGLGIGATIASKNISKLPLVFCGIIAIVVVVLGVRKK